MPGAALARALAAALLLAAAPPRAAAAAPPPPPLALPSACAAGDTRCVLLQREVCDPWNRTAVAADEQCAFVRGDARCLDDVRRVNYLAALYCHPRAAAAAALALWAAALFALMAAAAEGFLCPAAEYLAAAARLPPDVAGVTLFAFAAGAPDLFTQVAALAGGGGGSHVDVELAVAATFGSGLFIIGVVLPAALLALPRGADGGPPRVPDRRAFVRDAAAYALACAAALGLLWAGRLTALDGGLLLLGYFAYLGVCLATRAAGAVVASVPGAPGGGGGGGGAALGGRDLELAPLPRGAAGKAAAPAGAGGGGGGGSEFKDLETAPLTGGPDPVAVGPPSASASPRRELRRSTGARWPPGAGAAAPPAPATLAELARGWAAAAPAAAAEALHLRGAAGWRLAARVLAAPLLAPLHLTMPALHGGGGAYSMGYGAVLAACAPAFTLSALGLGARRLGPAGFAAACAASTAGLLIAMYLQAPPPPSAGPASPRAPGAPGAPCAAGAAPPPWLARLAAPRARRSGLMAGLALAASVAWLDVAADELVALVEAAGRAWNVRRDVLGATALAWGETVPDLVAVVSLARGGQGTMAVAACFGGPVFNLLVSMGAPILFAGVAHGPMPFVMTSGVVALVVATVAILVALLATVPARLGWRLPPVLAAAVLAGWAAAQAAFLLAEGRAL